MVPTGKILVNLHMPISYLSHLDSLGMVKRQYGHSLIIRKSEAGKVVGFIDRSETWFTKRYGKSVALAYITTSQGISIFGVDFYESILIFKMPS